MSLRPHASFAPDRVSNLVSGLNARCARSFGRHGRRLYSLMDRGGRWSTGSVVIAGRQLMKFATTFAAMMIAGILPLAPASEPASAKVFDWSLTGPAPALGGLPLPGSGTITASPTESTGVWAIDTITGVINGSEITGPNAFEGADNLVFTNGFAFVSTVGISFEAAAGQ